MTFNLNEKYDRGFSSRLYKKCVAIRFPLRFSNMCFCNFYIRDWNNESKFHLTIPTKVKHPLTRIKIFIDNIFGFLNLSIRNFRSISRFGRRTMKNVRHLMWRVVNYDQFEGFTFHIHNEKNVTVLNYTNRNRAMPTLIFITSLKDVIIFEILSSLRLKINFLCRSSFRQIKR